MWIYSFLHVVQSVFALNILKLYTLLHVVLELLYIMRNDAFIIMEYLSLPLVIHNALKFTLSLVGCCLWGHTELDITEAT